MSELSQGTQINNRYTLQEYKGSGSFGEVWLAHDDIIDTDVALKIYVSLNPAGISQFTEEYKTTANLSHPNLLTAKHFDVWERRPFLEMKYCGKGSADKLVGNITEKELWHFIHDVAAGLHYLHALPEPIIHQDIKPDNVLMDDDGMFLITDFGISKQLRATIRKQSGRFDASGSCAYMAPERFNADPKPIKASDIWSLGASIYELAKGELPFYGQGGVMLKNGADLPELGDGWSSELNQTIQACLAKDPWDRPTAEQLEKYAESMLQGLESGRPVATAPWIQTNKKSTTAKPSAGNATVPIGKQGGANEGTNPTSNTKTSSNKWLWSLLIIPIVILGVWGICQINKGNDISISQTSSSSSPNDSTYSQTTSLEDTIVSNSHQGHTYVDLGLPSGTLWATCNIGADSPEDYGSYFAWGETKTKTYYGLKTYKFGNDYSSFTKYSTNSSYGHVDNKTRLEPEDDAAYVIWGGNWRIPTAQQFRELIKHCDWFVLEMNDINVYQAKGKNGNCIYIPAAGWYNNSSQENSRNKYGHYWASTLKTSESCFANYLSFEYGYTPTLSARGRDIGRSIRPVFVP